MSMKNTEREVERKLISSLEVTCGNLLLSRNQVASVVRKPHKHEHLKNGALTCKGRCFCWIADLH